MKTYLAIFLAPPAALKKWGALSAKVRRERQATGFKAWRAWGAKNRKSMVDKGAPLGGTKQVDRKGVANIRNGLTAYAVVRASSHAAAAKIFRDHPHLTVFFPSGSVEVVETMRIRGL